MTTPNLLSPTEVLSPAESPVSASQILPRSAEKPYDWPIGIPPSFTNKTTAAAAWSAWYGSQKDAAAVVELVAKHRISELGDSRMCLRIPAWSALTSWFSSESCVAAIQREIPDAASKVFPRGRMHAQLASLLRDRETAINQLCEMGSITDIASAVEKEFPWMTRIIDRGLLDRRLASGLLSLAEVIRAAQKVPAGTADRHRYDMAALCLLSRIPEPFHKVLSSFNGWMGEIQRHKVTQKAPEEGDQKDCGEKDDWSAVGTSHYTQCVAQMSVAYAYKSVSHAVLDTETQLDVIERVLLAGRQGSDTLSEVAEGFISETAAVNWVKLLDSLQGIASTVEITLNRNTLPRDLFAKKLPSLPAPSAEAALLLRTVHESTLLHSEPDAFAGRAKQHLSRVQQVQEQIQQLGTDLTAGNMLKLAELAERGRDEIVAAKDWFASEIQTYEEEAQRWRTFFAGWAALAVAPKKARDTAPEKGMAVPAPALVLPESQVVASLRSDLQQAEERNGRTKEELRTAETEVHRLKLALEARQSAQGQVPVIDAALLRRVATRKDLTPTDVLAYIESVSEGRVEVLDSAWKSAKAVEHFAYPDRMLEILDTLVNPYYEAIAAGNPDTVARDHLGNAYSAKESKTTLSTPRLRAMREFIYNGERQLFERHLRVGSNSVGARECMRIYFQIIDTKVVIAYAGEHLEIPSTN